MKVEPDAFDYLEDALRKDEPVFGGSGRPRSGRAASRRRRHRYSEINGNLFAMKRIAVCQIRGQAISLPSEIYWVGGLLGSLMNFGFASHLTTFDHRRIITVPEASWHYRSRSVRKPRDIVRYLRRLCRQARGDIGQRAIRSLPVAESIDPCLLPASCRQLVVKW